MTCTDIATLIEACGNHGVKSLVIGDLSIETHDISGKVKSVDTWNDTIETTPVDSDSPDIYNDDEEDPDEDARAIDELKFTNPELWDEMARDGVA